MRISRIKGSSNVMWNVFVNVLGVREVRHPRYVL